MQLLTQHGEIAVAGGMQKTDRRIGSADPHNVIRSQIERHLPVEVHAGVYGVNDADFDSVAITHQDRAIGQRMRVTSGCRIGPLAESEYAVDPVDVEAIKPSERRL